MQYRQRPLEESLEGQVPPDGPVDKAQSRCDDSSLADLARRGGQTEEADSQSESRLPSGFLPGRSRADEVIHRRLRRDPRCALLPAHE